MYSADALFRLGTDDSAQTQKSVGVPDCPKGIFGLESGRRLSARLQGTTMECVPYGYRILQRNRFAKGGFLKLILVERVQSGARVVSVSSPIERLSHQRLRKNSVRSGTNRYLSSLFGLLVALALSGCGGGSGGSADTGKPATTSCPQRAVPTSPVGSIGAIVDAAVADAIISQKLPGISVSVAKQGGTLYEQGYGYSNLESCAPVQSTTVFQIGSVTK